MLDTERAATTGGTTIEHYDMPLLLAPYSYATTRKQLRPLQQQLWTAYTPELADHYTHTAEKYHYSKLTLLEAARTLTWAALIALTISAILNTTNNGITLPTILITATAALTWATKAAINNSITTEILSPCFGSGLRIIDTAETAHETRTNNRNN